MSRASKDDWPGRGPRFSRPSKKSSVNFPISGALKTEHRQLGGQDSAQQEPQPPEQNVEVVADRGEYGVDGVAGAVSKVIALFPACPGSGVHLQGQSALKD
jgi:hypothetical protein